MSSYADEALQPERNQLGKIAVSIGIVLNYGRSDGILLNRCLERLPNVAVMSAGFVLIGFQLTGYAIS